MKGEFGKLTGGKFEEELNVVRGPQTLSSKPGGIQQIFTALLSDIKISHCKNFSV